MIVKCENCGKEFYVYDKLSYIRKFCGRECVTEYRINNRSIQKQDPESNYNKIVDIAVKSRKAGLSYGYYVATKEYPVKITRKKVSK